ncbi:putative secondary metabolism biosynthetic enzyme [Microsporum canis]
MVLLFTSGSTGLPKGTIITHSSFTTAINHHGKVFGICSGERVYDFASYSFDIAWFNALKSLSHGACLCIPSEHERKNDLEGSILRSKATVIFITPSVARLLKAHNLPCIKCVALGGEPQKPWQTYHNVDSIPSDAKTDFWRQQFFNLKAVQFPALPSPNFRSSPDNVMHYEIPEIVWSGRSFTPSTMIRAVWAILIAQYMNVQEALFGVITSGRQAAVRDINHIMGPTIATVPVRVMINWETSLQAFLSQIQKQATEMISFEQTGLQNIQHISDDVRRGCQFQSLLLVKSDVEVKRNPESSLFYQRPILNLHKSENATVDTFSTYSIVLECQIEDRGLDLRLIFDLTIIKQQNMERLVQQFEHLLRHASSLVSHLETITFHDIQNIWEWNKIPPALLDRSSIADISHNYYRSYYREYWCVKPATPKVYWVLDMNKNQLAAIGAVGELWLEVSPVNGMLMAQVKNAEAESVDDPVWLLQGASVDLPGRQGRIYRTGDLVKYNQDGSLSFMGQRETQVDRKDMLIPSPSCPQENALVSVSQNLRVPQTHLQKQIQSLWSRIFNIPTNSISLDDHFMRFGGDSVKTMRLAALAQNEGISLSVANILRPQEGQSDARRAEWMARMARTQTSGIVFCAEDARLLDVSRTS